IPFRNACPTSQNEPTPTSSAFLMAGNSAPRTNSQTTFSTSPQSVRLLTMKTIHGSTYPLTNPIPMHPANGQIINLSPPITLKIAPVVTATRLHQNHEHLALEHMEEAGIRR